MSITQVNCTYTGGVCQAVLIHLCVDDAGGGLLFSPSTQVY